MLRILVVFASLNILPLNYMVVIIVTITIGINAMTLIHSSFSFNVVLNVDELVESFIPPLSTSPSLSVWRGREKKPVYMMTSSNGNIFRVTGPLCGEFTGHRWIPRTKASDAELWCFLWSAPWINGWVNNRKAGDLRCHRTYHDVTVMNWIDSQWIGGDINGDDEGDEQMTLLLLLLLLMMMMMMVVVTIIIITSFVLSSLSERFPHHWNPLVTGGLTLQRVSDTERWCYFLLYEQCFGQTMEFPVNWNAMMLI